MPETGAPDTAAPYPTLRLAHLYPSLLNVAGDGGNVMAVVQRCAWRGAKGTLRGLWRQLRGQ